MSMTLAGLGFLAYLLWGNLLEDVPVLDAFAHDGFRITRALNFLYLQPGRRVRHHGQRAGHLRDPVHLLRRPS